MKFYKGVLQSDLKNDYIPGTVTTIFKEALMWCERISSSKKKGAAKHVRHGKAVIIEIEYHGILLSHDEFQRSNIEEHKRENCWTSIHQDKAQINSICSYRILNKEEIDQLFSY